MLVQNEIFLGLVRERAQFPKSALKSATLTHLLRQAIVASCTALDAYLPALLRSTSRRSSAGRAESFAARRGDERHWSELTLQPRRRSQVERRRGRSRGALHVEQAAQPGRFKYLSSKTGVHVVGVLLGIGKPWDQIAAHLGRDKKELTAVLEAPSTARNDIVHRADREKAAPGAYSGAS